MPSSIQIYCRDCKSPLPPLMDAEVLICPVCGKQLTAYEAGMEEVREYIRWVNMIPAIARYRQLTGSDLKTAKDAVTEMWHSGDI